MHLRSPMIPKNTLRKANKTDQLINYIRLILISTIAKSFKANKSINQLLQKWINSDHQAQI